MDSVLPLHFLRIVPFHVNFGWDLTACHVSGHQSIITIPFRSWSDLRMPDNQRIAFSSTSHQIITLNQSISHLLLYWSWRLSSLYLRSSYSNRHRYLWTSLDMGGGIYINHNQEHQFTSFSHRMEIQKLELSIQSSSHQYKLRKGHIIQRPGCNRPTHCSIGLRLGYKDCTAIPIPPDL